MDGVYRDYQLLHGEVFEERYEEKEYEITNLDY